MYLISHNNKMSSSLDARECDQQFRSKNQGRLYFVLQTATPLSLVPVNFSSKVDLQGELCFALYREVLFIKFKYFATIALYAEATFPILRSEFEVVFIQIFLCEPTDPIVASATVSLRVVPH